MTVTLDSTSSVVECNGVKCRVWEGTTAKGVRVFALIPRIAAHKDDDLAEFARELEEQIPPSVEALRVFPLRMIL